jgi:hypothetical protein
MIIDTKFNIGDEGHMILDGKVATVYVHVIYISVFSASCHPHGEIKVIDAEVPEIRYRVRRQKPGHAKPLPERDALDGELFKTKAELAKSLGLA